MYFWRALNVDVHHFSHIRDPKLVRKWRQCLKCKLFVLWKRLYPGELKYSGETSLAVQWLRICLPVQGTQVLLLIREIRFHVPCGNYAYSLQLRSKLNKYFKKSKWFSKKWSEITVSPGAPHLREVYLYVCRSLFTKAFWNIVSDNFEKVKKQIKISGNQRSGFAKVFYTEWIKIP